MDSSAVLGKQGRLVIPLGIRTELGLVAGESLVLHVDAGRLVVERPANAVAALKLLAADVPRSRSLVEELLQERRQEAGSEQ